MELYNGLDFLWGWRFAQVAASEEELSLKDDEYGAVVNNGIVSALYKGSIKAPITIGEYELLQNIEILKPSETDYENVGWLEWDEVSGNFQMKLKFGALAEAYYYFGKITGAGEADGIYISPNFRIYGSSKVSSDSEECQLLLTADGFNIETSDNNIIISKEWGTF